MNENSIVAQKSKAFALKIIKLYKYMCNEQKEYVLSKQILRCGTSIGANVTEALKESQETLYWLDLIHESQYINDEQYNFLYSDCVELSKLLSSITKTTKEKLSSNK